MKRREFILLLGGIIALEPIPLWAQQNARFFKIGHLESGTPSTSPHLLGAFRHRSDNASFVTGQILGVNGGKTAS
jgi:folate-dependent tRNA-U54 methylase TrmFO/GidA